MTATRLTLHGESTTTDAGARLRVGAAAASTRLGASFGAAWQGPGVTLGAAYHTGATFEATRSATRNGAWDDRGSAVAVRRPWRASLGASYAPSLRVTLYGQADLRGQGTLTALPARSPAKTPVDTPERAGLAALRAGVQYAVPLARVSLVARAGVARPSEAGLRRSVEALGRTVHAGTHAATTRVTAGLGVAVEKGTLDLAYDGQGRWTVAVRLRL